MVHVIWSVSVAANALECRDRLYRIELYIHDCMAYGAFDVLFHMLGQLTSASPDARLPVSEPKI